MVLNYTIDEVALISVGEDEGRRWEGSREECGRMSKRKREKKEGAGER